MGGQTKILTPKISRITVVIASSVIYSSSSLPLALPRHLDGTCECQIVNVLTMKATQTELTLTSTPATSAHNPQEIITLPGLLPSEECGDDHSRCPLQCDKDGDNLVCSFPAITNGTRNNLVFLHLRQADNVQFQTIQTKVVPVAPPELDCAPVQYFDRGPNVHSRYRYIVHCLNITSASPGVSYAYYLPLEYDRTNISSARLVDDKMFFPSSYYPMEGTTQSRLIYQEHSNSACIPSGNIFMKDGSRIVTFELGYQPDFRVRTNRQIIEGCPNTLDFQLLDDDLLRVQCSVEDVVLYDVCRTEKVVKRYNTSLNGTTQYQCSAAKLNLFLSGSYLSVEHYGTDRDNIDYINNLTLPFGNITHARCFGKKAPLLFLTRQNGQAFLLFLTNGRLFSLAENSCTGSSCLAVDVLKTKFGIIFGIFDYKTNHYIVVNSSRPDNPIIASLLYVSHPLPTTLVLGKGTQPCACPTKGPPTKQPPISSSPAPTNHTSSTTAFQPTEQSSPVHSPTAEQPRPPDIDGISNKPPGEDQNAAIGTNHILAISGSTSLGVVVSLLIMVGIV